MGSSYQRCAHDLGEFRATPPHHRVALRFLLKFHSAARRDLKKISAVGHDTNFFFGSGKPHLCFISGTHFNLTRTLSQACHHDMGKKGKPSAGKAAAKAAKKEKAEKQATRKLTKQVAKQKSQTNAGSSSSNSKQNGKKGAAAIDDDEEDLDALLARYREQWEQEHVVSEEKVGGPPSRRANATFTPCPLGNDLYLFGGEYFNGERVAFYQDMYRYIPEKNEWRTYASKNQPGPRSAHQVAATPAQGGMLWLFGGEFSGARQNAFHHYRDLWAFSIESKAWERIDTKLRPSARSGHRMTFWKHYLVLFGGFIDTGVKTQYLNDLWIFDTQNTFKWTEIKQNDLRRPPPRSGFSFISCPEGVVLYGGYCKKYVKGQRTQGVALEDTWLLKMDEDLTKLDWTKRRRSDTRPILCEVDAQWRFGSPRAWHPLWWCHRYGSRRGDHGEHLPQGLVRLPASRYRQVDQSQSQTAQEEGWRRQEEEEAQSRTATTATTSPRQRLRQ